MTVSSADRFADGCIGRVREPPNLSAEELRALAIKARSRKAIKAIDRGDLTEAKSLLAELGVYHAPFED